MIRKVFWLHRKDVALLVNLPTHEHVGACAGRKARVVIRPAATICFLYILTSDLYDRWC
jgi:hypothetical protein